MSPKAEIRSTPKSHGPLQDENDQRPNHNDSPTAVPQRRQNKSDEFDWKRRVVRKLKELWNDEAFVSQAKWTAGTTVMALAAVTMYSNQQRRHRNSAEHTQQVFGPTAKRNHSLVTFMLAFLRRPEYYSKAVTVSLSMLQIAARNGLVKKAFVGPGEVYYQDSTSGAWRRSKLPSNSPNIQTDLLESLGKHGCDDVSALPESLASRVATPVLAALPFVYLALVYKIFKNVNGGGDMKLLTNTNQRSTTRFTDVAGLGSIMLEVQEVVSYLRQSHRYRALGAQPPRGVLLQGPPGSGKTLLARAVAGEADAAFVACSGSEFCEMYVGRGAARVRSLFAQARTLAIQRRRQRSRRFWTSWLPYTSTLEHADDDEPPPPTAIIFIDEFDALAKSRAFGGFPQGSNDERESTLNQLLTEMDGFSTSSTNNGETEATIILIAATNRPDVLDPAILRRFDRQIHVPYPDSIGRRDIFRVHARAINCRTETIDWDFLASDNLTVDFSGSDLRNVVNDAALLAVREESLWVEQCHLLHAIRRAQAMKATADLRTSKRNDTPSRGIRFSYLTPLQHP